MSIEGGIHHRLFPELVRSGEVPETRLNESVTRVLGLKAFEKVTHAPDESRLASFVLRSADLAFIRHDNSVLEPGIFNCWLPLSAERGELKPSFALTA